MKRCLIVGLHSAVLCAGVLMAFAPMIFSGCARLQTDPGDTLLNHYVLEHSWKWLTDGNYHVDFWSPAFFYPTCGTLAYSENLIGSAPVYWLLRCAVSELLAFQLWMIALAALTYAATAWVLRKIGVTHVLAAVGALSYAFGLPRVAQVGHQQLIGSMFSPLAVYWLWQFLEHPTTRRLSLTGACVVLQLLIGVYLGWFLTFGLIVFAGTRMIDLPTRVRAVAYFRSHWRSAGLVFAAMFGSLAVLFGPYLTVNSDYRRLYRQEVALMLPRPESYFSPPPASWWTTILPSVTGPLNHEHHLFAGAAFLLCLTAAAVCMRFRRRNQTTLAVAALAAAAILTLISLKLGTISAWRLVYACVPGASAIRAATRIFTITYLFAWIGSLGLISQTLAYQRRLLMMFGMVALTVAVIDHVQTELPSFDPKPFYAEVDRLACAMNGAQIAYVELDENSLYWVSHLAAMWAGLKANVPVVNGYSGRTPTGYPDERMILSTVELSQWLGDQRLSRLQIVGPPRLAKAYPAPAAPPNMPSLDFRPYHSLQTAEHAAPCPITPTKR